jgi:hypothetical protein
MAFAKCFLPAGVFAALCLWPAGLRGDGAQAQTAKDSPPKQTQPKQQQPGKQTPQDTPFNLIEETLSESERSELRKLRAENPEEFRKRIRDKIQALKEKKTPESGQIFELADKYQKTSAPQEREDIRKQLRDLTAKQFQNKMRANKERIDVAEKRLQELKKEYDERMRKADDIIDRRVDDLTRDPTVRW